MKRVLISASVLALAVTGMSQSSAAPAGEKVTGGGQTLVANQSAGNTIAFNAQESATGVKGQVQYVNRTAGTGKAQVVKHGVVTCLDVVTPGDGGTARIGGYFDGNEAMTFTIDVTDGGEGAGDMADFVTLREGDDSNTDGDDDSSCTDRGDFKNNVELARGNVQVHKAK